MTLSKTSRKTQRKKSSVHEADLDALLARAAAQDTQDSWQYRALESRVLQQTLPPQPFSLIDSLIQWLSPQSFAGWRAPFAASFALMLGIAVANVYDFGLNSSDAYGSEFTSWDDELSLLSFADLSSSVSLIGETTRTLNND